jgi:hypothetical protein
MRRTVNVKALIGQGKRYNVNERKRLKMVRRHGFLNQGSEYNIKGKLADSLLKTGKAVEVKESKVAIVTKEEKFAPQETKAPPKDFSEVPVSQLLFDELSDDDLLGIIKTDNRISAVRAAKKELQRREG